MSIVRSGDKDIAGHVHGVLDSTTYLSDKHPGHASCFMLPCNHHDTHAQTDLLINLT